MPTPIKPLPLSCYPLDLVAAVEGAERKAAAGFSLDDSSCSNSNHEASTDTVTLPLTTQVIGECATSSG